MTKEIVLKYGKHTELMNVFKTTAPTVRAALRGETNSELARKIRFTAVEHFGGVEVK